MASIELTSASGMPIESIFARMEGAAQPNESDMALAGEFIRSSIRENCERGVDVDGVAFRPYSTKGPYYYSPSSSGGKFSKGSNSAAKRSAKRLAGKIPGSATSSTGKTLKFDNYAAFKAAFGRGVVDLQGVAPPHMLDAIQVQASVAEARVGIYDPTMATRASGHNFGNRYLPVRRFFGISKEARERILRMFRDRIIARLRGATS